jgi:hypothetical protein
MARPTISLRGASARIAVVAKKRSGAPVWQVLAQNERESRERRRKLIAGARASAKNIVRDGHTFKLVKLPPELGRSSVERGTIGPQQTA